MALQVAPGTPAPHTSLVKSADKPEAGSAAPAGAHGPRRPWGWARRSLWGLLLAVTVIVTVLVVREPPSSRQQAQKLARLGAGLH